MASIAAQIGREAGTEVVLRKLRGAVGGCQRMRPDTAAVDERGIECRPDGEWVASPAHHLCQALDQIRATLSPCDPVGRPPQESLGRESYLANTPGNAKTSSLLDL